MSVPPGDGPHRYPRNPDIRPEDWPDPRRIWAKVSSYFDIKRDDDGHDYIDAHLRGIALLRFVLTNKGTAFTDEERTALGLQGLLPPRVSNLDEQIERAYIAYQRQQTPIDRYRFLRGLQERQEILFYALVAAHVEEMLPIIYTPTVGEAVENYSRLFEAPRGLVLERGHVPMMDRVMASYPLNDIRFIVATDGSAILGIGDQGTGGLAISIGKLSLYTVCGGVSPFHSMAVQLDVGTDRQALRDDPLYLGTRTPRLRGDDYCELVDAFVDAVHRRWPKAVIQWEDLSKDVAFAVLERYRDRIPSFNDDIQGTGAVALAGLIGACRQKGQRLADQRFLVYGAGAGGLGVAWAIHQGLQREGLSAEEATERLLVLDSRGLLVEGRRMDEYKRPFAQKASVLAGWTFAGDVPDLLETAREGGVTALVGLSGQPGSFTRPVVEAVLAHTDRPIVFPLSNPTKLCEASPADVLAWTDGRALVATGSPFDPVQVGDALVPIGQGNNAFVFPGLGLGAVLSGATRVTDGMVLAASYALADYVREHHEAAARLFPPVPELRAVSRLVAAAVVSQAFEDGVATAPAVIARDPLTWVDQHVWEPRYLPVRAGEITRADGHNAAEETA